MANSCMFRTNDSGTFKHATIGAVFVLDAMPVDLHFMELLECTRTLQEIAQLELNMLSRVNSILSMHLEKEIQHYMA